MCGSCASSDALMDVIWFVEVRPIGKFVKLPTPVFNYACIGSTFLNCNVHITNRCSPNGNTGIPSL